MRRLLIGATVLALLVVFIRPAQAQTPTPPVYVRQLLATMTPEERVGQLFVVTFTGTDVSETSQVYNLIANYHVGGVALLAANDNFTAAPNTAADAYALIDSLQEIKRSTAKTPLVDATTGEQTPRVFIPLWIGISQEGNGASTDQILNGLTPLPSE